MTAATVPTDQYVAYARKGQEIATAAAEGYAGAFKAYADAVIPQGPRPVDPQAATAATFDLAEKLVTVQRELRHRHGRPRQGGRRDGHRAGVRRG